MILKKFKKNKNLHSKIWYLYYLYNFNSLYVYQKIFWKYLSFYLNLILLNLKNYKFLLNYNLKYIYMFKYFYINPYLYKRIKQLNNKYITQYYWSSILRLCYFTPLITVID